MLILHLSDIHFRKGEVGSALDPNSHLRTELLHDAARRCQGLGKAPAAIIVSGDLTFAGHPEEYAYALSWLDQLCGACGTQLDSVFVVPGNHDVVRSIAGRRTVQALHQSIKAVSENALEGTMSGLLNDPEAARLLYESHGPFNDFAGQFFCDLLPPERTIARRDLRLNDGSTLRLAGLNSAFVSSAADAKGELFVDPAAFQIVRERGVEHLVVCHHPFAWLKQAEALKDFLNDVARIHLFGHEHTNRIELGRDWVRISASAAHPEKSEPGWEPGYNLIELEVQSSGAERQLFIGVHVLVWQQRPGEFRPKTDRGAEVFRQKIDLDGWAAPQQPPPEVQTGKVPAATEIAQATQTDAGSDPMDSVRNISIRFFKLTLSQKSAIAGKLNLLEEEDANQPDFERFRRVFTRAQQRGLVEQLDREVSLASGQRK